MDSKTLINIFRDLFIAYGVSEEISSDGGPQFKSSQFDQFLKTWGVKWRPSSASYPQSNGRAELGVKAAKRIIHNNVSADGSLNNDGAARAILQYRNTPLPDLQLSPAQILFHRQLRDSLPAHPSHYRLHQEWIVDAERREQSYAKRNALLVQKYNARARTLKPLEEGTDVLIQSQGFKKAWDRQGRIVASLPNRQYRVKMSPSGRISLQNRRFLQPLPPDTEAKSTNIPAIIPSPGSMNIITRARAGAGGVASTPAAPFSSQANQSSGVIPQSCRDLPAVPSQPPTARLQAPAASPQLPAARPQSPAARPQSPTARPQSPVDLPQSTLAPEPSKSVPRMLRNLRTFNKPGLKEMADVGGERR